MLLMNQLKSSLQSEIDRFFSVLGLSVAMQRVVTKVAICKARKKLKYSAFIELNDVALSSYYREFPETKNWFGFRLLAIDGSKVELPSQGDIREYFMPHKDKERPMGLLSTLFDLNQHLWLDAELAPISTGERELAVRHLSKTNENDLVIYDRGYAALWFLALHQKINRQFCMRLQKNLFKESTDFIMSGKKDAIVSIRAGKQPKKVCKELGLSCDPITVRLIRIELDSGEVEILATSLLDQQRYPTAIFADLYHRRWKIEEGYKHFKIHLELQNWSGRSLDTVLQDIYAKLFILNLAAMNAAVAQMQVDEETKHRRHSYQVNFSQALSKMKDFLVKIFYVEEWTALLRQLLDATAQDIEAIRSNRKYPRKPRTSKGINYRPGYK